MKTVFLSSAYLAPVEYYSKLVTYDKVFIEQHDHYMKQTYRNRCTIAGPDKRGFSDNMILWYKSEKA